ncbi:hypothetical protein SCWH03_42310 [Streptomyces pacificus]|uniref:Uncharacterized protein n=1 Tax=Streptomyces pacificus TaxID=2705029 RepID=A0A6A0B075_9ACTN|nr:hypothetical protein SCWH03_42310 [Streptomyces pacificus]
MAPSATGPDPADRHRVAARCPAATRFDDHPGLPRIRCATPAIGHSDPESSMAKEAPAKLLPAPLTPLHGGGDRTPGALLCEPQRWL